MIVAPDGSFAVMLTGMETALPINGVVFASVMQTDETTPSSVIGTLVVSGPIVALMLPEASCDPVAPAPE